MNKKTCDITFVYTYYTEYYYVKKIIAQENVRKVKNNIKLNLNDTRDSYVSLREMKGSSAAVILSVSDISCPPFHVYEKYIYSFTIIINNYTYYVVYWNFFYQ